MCDDCHNQTPAGRKVVGHKPGSPNCPLVKAKLRPMHPKFHKVIQEGAGNPGVKKPLTKKKRRSMTPKDSRGRFVKKGTSVNYVMMNVGGSETDEDPSSSSPGRCEFVDVNEIRYGPGGRPKEVIALAEDDTVSSIAGSMSRGVGSSGDTRKSQLSAELEIDDGMYCMGTDEGHVLVRGQNNAVAFGIPPEILTQEQLLEWHHMKETLPAMCVTCSSVYLKVKNSQVPRLESQEPHSLVPVSYTHLTLPTKA